MRKIYIVGYFKRNLGDDLFLNLLTHRYPNCQFYICINKKYAKYYKHIKNLQLIKVNTFMENFNKLTAVLFNGFKISDMKIKNVDAVIILGGSLFDEQFGSLSLFNLYKKWLIKNKKLFIINPSFGPCNTEKYYLKVRRILNYAQDICFRDLYSYKKFHDLKCVRYAPDMVFKIANNNSLNESKEKILAISVVNLKILKLTKSYNFDYIKFLTKIINSYISKNYKIRLLAFSEALKDNKIIEEIMQNINKNNKSKIEIITYNNTNMDVMLNAIQTSSKLIATRFHSLVLGLSYGVPTLPIIYHQKLLTVLEELGYEKYAIKLDKLKEINIKELKFIKISNKMRKDLANKADNQFVKLDKFIND